MRTIAPLAIVKTSGKSKKSLISQIYERQTPEIIIALCGPIGSGVTKVADIIKSRFVNFGYLTQYIKVSSIIDEIGDNDGHQDIAQQNKFEKIKRLQLKGNALREKHEYDILAQHIIKKIAIQRELWKSETSQDDIVHYRNVTIIDSLKHPDEANLLRMVYGDMFYLFGVLCPENLRLARLETDSRLLKQEAIDIIERDKAEDDKHGQQLLETIKLADFFVSNTHDREDTLVSSIERFITLILGDIKPSPTVHEYAMFLAQSAAMRSACLSRQVGAAIISSDGDVLSTGRNDVPRFGGGIYCEDDNKIDHRCVHKGYCASDREKKDIIDSLKNDILPYITGDDADESIAKVVEIIEKQPRLKGLIEFSRAVHAEMDAITTVAKNGGRGTIGATLYCTTFPCHHCARHIVSSGIKRVYYIEPYEKSLASILHWDSVASDASDDIKSKVLVTPFEGVAPRKYLQLFSYKSKKKDGRRIDLDFKVSKPTIIKMLDAHIDYEARVVEMIATPEE